jgi:flagellar basal body-associated protein FliL
VGHETAPQTAQREAYVSILWIILIVVLVLALLGFFSRGAW